jgi:PAS domain S-box-containing protein
MGDLRRNVVYTNRRVGELAGLPSEDLTGTPVSKVMARILSRAHDEATARKDVERALRNETAAVEFSLALHGRETHIRIQTFDVNDSRGISIGQGIILKDVTMDLELDRMKSSLISTVSHELRTPLAAIKGYATTLLAEDVHWDPQAQREFLGIISNESTG